MSQKYPHWIKEKTELAFFVVVSSRLGHPSSLWSPAVCQGSVSRPEPGGLQGGRSGLRHTAAAATLWLLVPDTGRGEQLLGEKLCTFVGQLPTVGSSSLLPTGESHPKSRIHPKLGYQMYEVGCFSPRITTAKNKASFCAMSVSDAAGAHGLAAPGAVQLLKMRRED